MATHTTAVRAAHVAASAAPQPSHGHRDGTPEQRKRAGSSELRSGPSRTRPKPPEHEAVVGGEVHVLLLRPVLVLAGPHGLHLPQRGGHLVRHAQPGARAARGGHRQRPVAAAQQPHPARLANEAGTARSQAESAKLRHAPAPAMASMAVSCARAAASAVSNVPSQSLQPRLPGTRTSHTHRPALPRRRTPRNTGCRVSRNLVHPAGRFGGDVHTVWSTAERRRRGGRALGRSLRALWHAATPSTATSARQRAGERRRVADPGRRPPDLAGRRLPPPVTAGHDGGEEEGGGERGVKETRTGPPWGSRRRRHGTTATAAGEGRRGGGVGGGAVAPRVARCRNIREVLAGRDWAVGEMLR
ncbi:hypothetical protein SORBI_3005G077532 [Sorghum bicolor]|uniref:Uncharacterized protein n=1 Tax=Sorghum bicolor TaxID=4558 RepID=A0A1Z5RH65_SORBI|nr:hypothetical protein SORBI_3005G077532 [Sorghum bicolor]